MEKIKLVCDMSESEVTGLLIQTDARVQHRRDSVTEIVRVEQFTKRLRAVFSTYAYCALGLADFFSLEQSENFVDTINEIAWARAASAENRREIKMTVIELQKAYKEIMVSFHLKVRNNSARLGDLTENETFWRHHWTFAAPVYDEPSAAPVPIQDRSENTDIAAMRTQLSALQSRVDRDRRARGGGGRGGGGRGGGGGNGRGSGGRGDAAARVVRGDGAGNANGGGGGRIRSRSNRGARGGGQ